MFADIGQSYSLYVVSDIDVHPWVYSPEEKRYQNLNTWTSTNTNAVLARRTRTNVVQVHELMEGLSS